MNLSWVLTSSTGDTSLSNVLLQRHLSNSTSAIIPTFSSASSSENTASGCMRFVDKDPDPTNSTLAITIFAFVYLNIFVLGLVGNLSIACLTIKHRHLRTVQNIFILNLAISDVIVCLLSLPFTPVTNIYKIWLFGQPICHLLPLVQVVIILTFEKVSLCCL